MASHVIISRDAQHEVYQNVSGLLPRRVPVNTTIRQCKYCGCSENMIRHMGWEECSGRDRSEGEPIEQGADDE